MNKLELLVAAFFMFACMFNVNAQEESNIEKTTGPYVRVALGYGFGAGVGSPIGEDALTTIGAEIDNIDTNYTQRNITGSYGKGFNATVAVGHYFNRFFGMELGATYLLGSKQDILNISTSDGRSDVAETYTRQLRIKPALVFQAGTGKIVPYSRAGLVIPVVGASYGERLATYNDLLGSFPLAESFEGKSVAKGRFAIGFEGAIGANYNLSDKMGINAELFYTSLRVKRKSYEVTEAKLNNTDGTEQDVINLLGLAGAYIYTEYKDEINEADYDAYRDSVPAGAYGSKDYPHWALSEDGIFNAVGINIGLTYKF